MTARRFFITLTLLVTGLIALGAGVDRAMDRMTQSPAENSFVVYDPQGKTLYSYSGDLAAFNYSARPAPFLIVPLHRT